MDKNCGGRFKKGEPPWNKGLNISGMSGKKQSDKQKNAVKVANTKPDGTHKTPFDERVRKTMCFKEWSKKIIDRDKICAMCEQKKDKMHAHHIVSIKENLSLVYDLNNGAALCRRCHAIIHGFGHGGNLQAKSGDAKQIIVKKTL